MNNDTTKVCTRCGEEKPVSEFYLRSVAQHLLQAECKACVLERGKNYVRNKYVSVYPAEDDVIALLIKHGIHAELGKAINKKHIDVVAWGCVRIEVKSSTEKPDGSFSFTFNPNQQKNRSNINAVILVCMYPEYSTYHVFRSDHAVLRGNHSEIKGRVDYKPNAKHRHSKSIDSALTFEVMAEHENQWGIIDQIRAEISESSKDRSTNVNALTPAPNIASLFYPDDGDKNTRSSIKRYLQWLEDTGRNWLQADLKDYRDYLLNSSGLQVDTAKKHMERVRKRYTKMLNHNGLRDLIQAQIPKDATPADIYAITQEFLTRLSNNIVDDDLTIPQTKKASWVDSDFHWLTHDEMDAIFDRIPRDKAGYRDAALIALMYGYGLRKFEAIAVTVENLRETQNGVPGVYVLDGKGKKTAFVQRDELTDCQPIIDDWLAFAGITSGRVIEMGVSTVDTRIKRYTDASCHDFRRSYARHLYEGGRPIEYIRQQLRHSKVEVSMIYVGMIMKGGELR